MNCSGWMMKKGYIGSVASVRFYILSSYVHAGNIAGDSATYRDMVLNMEIISPLLVILTSNSAKVSMIRNVVWCISNLCRGKNPPPDFNKVCGFMCESYFITN